MVAIRTTKGAVKAPGNVQHSDVDAELDREITHPIRITMRIFHALLHRHEELFPQRKEPTMSPSEEHSPR